MIVVRKFKYKTEEEHRSLIKNTYQRQYSCLVRIFYNCLKNDPKFSQKEATALVKTLNNVESMKSYSVTAAYREAKAIIKRNKDKKIIFGGKKNFKKRLKGIISSEEWKDCRLLPSWPKMELLFSKEMYILE